MNIWAIVPIKPFNKAKSRLAKALHPEQREHIAESMFRRTVNVLTSVKDIRGVLVISRDTKVLAIARDLGAHTVQESGEPELNAALLRASQVAGMQHANGVLILPADLPLVTTDDIQQLLFLGRYHHSVVLAPDRNGDGTNAMLVVPPGLIPFSYGAGSYERHMALANAANATVQIYRSETLSLDIDTPEDLAMYYDVAGATALFNHQPNIAQS
jgi:2-phospho-L-lactate/phosphoenolpyruvate guanylyltransferase